MNGFFYKLKFYKFEFLCLSLGLFIIAFCLGILIVRDVGKAKDSTTVLMDDIIEDILKNGLEVTENTDLYMDVHCEENSAIVNIYHNGVLQKEIKTKEICQDLLLKEMGIGLLGGSNVTVTQSEPIPIEPVDLEHHTNIHVNSIYADCHKFDGTETWIYSGSITAK